MVHTGWDWVQRLGKTGSHAIMDMILSYMICQKPNIPLRPIVNNIESPTYNLAKFLSNSISNILGKMMIMLGTFGISKFL